MKSEQPQRFDVWINPAARDSASDLIHVLDADFHLVVVPKTGTRTADVAVLCDPPAQEVRRIRHILRGVPLVATTSQEPSAALRSELRRSGGQVLVRPSASELLEAVRRLRPHVLLPG